jgi:signal transduction histidine kinase/CheY-like chemotaxis protein
MRRRDSEERLSYLLELTDTLRLLEDPTAALKLLCEHLDVPRAHLAEYDDDEGVAVVRWEYVRGDAPSLRGRHPLARHSQIVDVLRTGQPYVAKDRLAEESRPEIRAQLEALNVRGQCVVPLVKKGTVVASLAVTDIVPRTWTLLEISIIRETAERTWAEQQLASQARLLATAAETKTFLLKLSDALRPLADPVAIQREASRILRATLGADSVAYWEVVGDETAAIAEDRLPDMTSFLGDRHRLGDYGPTLEEYMKGRTTCRSDVAAGAGFSPEQKAAYARQNVNAWAVSPLVKDGALLALLAICFRTAHDWTPGELALMQEAAERTWAAVERARAVQALRESEARARQMAEEAKAANRAKDAFLATLSHELRTPMSAILLWASALRSRAMSGPDLERAIEAIVQSAESQSQLIDDLLDLSRLTSGKLVLSPSPVDVGDLARTAIEMVRPAAEAKSIILCAEIEDDLGRAVLDGARVKQIVWNLLTNGTKFTPEGGSVRLVARKRGSYLELIVTDTGEGIAPDFLPHVFEMFRQADMGERRQHMGLGVGLALAKQLVTLHGGTIEAESEGRGRGATFRVRLPWVDPIAGTVGTSRMSARADAFRLTGVRLLLVEDDANTREAMRWMLERAGAAAVVAVPSTASALAALETVELPHVIVSDLGLPGVSGFELVALIAEHYRARGKKAPPACAVSAHARDVDRLRAIEAGFDMYLTKPVTAEQLVEAVSDLVEVLGSPVSG